MLIADEVAISNLANLTTNPYKMLPLKQIVPRLIFLRQGFSGINEQLQVNWNEIWNLSEYFDNNIEIK